MNDFSRPMMSEEDIDIIDRVFEEKKPKVCLEWGSGGSTIYFPRKHSCIEKWVSIEHDGKFYQYINRSVESKVELKLVKLEDYLRSAMDRKYDLILIDGLMRNECLMFSGSLLNEEGVVLLHDSGREEYQKQIKKWEGKSEKLSDGEIRVSGFAQNGIRKFWK